MSDNQIPVPDQNPGENPIPEAPQEPAVSAAPRQPEFQAQQPEFPTQQPEAPAGQSEFQAQQPVAQPMPEPVQQAAQQPVPQPGVDAPQAAPQYPQATPQAAPQYPQAAGGYAPGQPAAKAPGSGLNFSFDRVKESFDPKLDWHYLTLAGAVVLGLLGILLPFISVGPMSFSLIQGPDGFIILLFLVAVGVLGLLSLGSRKTALRIATGVVAVLTGLISFIDLANANGAANVGHGFGVSLGGGFFLLVLSALAFLAGGIASFFIKR
ncbi:hypothetical protein BSR28_05565 [Boudabousia liubingyangii]|uniref:hypothetical protein n=1 Tax=Boudabousia liubingyangii TaxID=1921764 RepID=UPI00093E89D7|nr:hypothetical protein [Boudabousia liubingyangii]OKL46893.1 hypothetical protein BSR28_05565 [Boudabousia liubingyangii]